MGRYQSIDYAAFAKRGFLLGVALFLFGALGGTVGAALFGPLDPLETQLLVDAEVVGIFVGLLAPLIFGVALPLTE